MVSGIRGGKIFGRRDFPGPIAALPYFGGWCPGRE
jgi:hypothetical protein